MCCRMWWAAGVLLLLLIAAQRVPGQTAGVDSAAGRLFGFLDRDGSGGLEPDELQAMPLPMRLWMEENRVETTKPLSREAFLQRAPAMMEAIRSGRFAGGETGPQPRVRVVESRPSVPTVPLAVNPAPRAASRSNGSGRYQLVVALPGSYAAADADQDGQIGLYEWRKWKKSALLEFLRLDRNRDGFLTPRELVSAPAVSSTPAAVSASTTNPTIPSSSATTSISSSTVSMNTGSSPSGGESTASSRTTTAAAGTPAPVEEYDPESTDAKTAIKYFDYMDEDKNGTIEPEELASKGGRIRPIVERSGIDMDQALSKDQLVTAYIKGKGASE